MNTDRFQQQLFNISTPEEFNALAMELFQFQARENAVYAQFLEALKCDPEQVADLASIPFLPIQFFKSKRVVTADAAPQIEFTSSGTTGMEPSRHYVHNLELYKHSFTAGFEREYGPVTNYRVLALLPSYLERSGSSLVYMVRDLIEKSTNPDSGFYLDDLDDLATTLKQLDAAGQPTMLIGVTFGLLDLAEQFPMPLKHCTIVETGGMKGRREELVRSELHRQLCAAFGVSSIHSEYGMTELLSQAWSRGEGKYTCPPWMQIRLREPNDPFSEAGRGRSGGVNVIDLANIWSCGFIATQDLGREHADGSIEILGRFDHSDLRGCSLMLA